MVTPPRRLLIRWLAWISGGLLALAVAATVGAWLLFKSLDMDAVVSRVESAVRKATGRALTIGGKPQLSLTPTLKLVMRDVSLANMADGGTRPDMIRLARVEIGVNLGPLARGNPPGLDIVLVRPDLWLEVTERGNANWTLEIEPEEAIRLAKQAVEILSGKVTLNSVRIEQAIARYNDRRQQRVLNIEARRAALAIKTDSGYALDVDGTLNGQPATVKADFQLPAYGEPASGRLAATLPGTAFSAEGVLHLTWPTEGSDVEIAASVEDLRGLGKPFGLSLPQLPPARLEARVKGDARGLRADAMTLTVGRTRIGGTVEMPRFEPRPLLRAQLDAPVIDLTELLPIPSQSAAPAKSERLFSSDRLPLEPLRWLDTESRIKVGRLVLPNAQAIETLEAGISLSGGRVKVAPLAFAVSSGRISGSVQLDASSTGRPAANVALQAKNVPLGALVALASLRGEGIRNAPTEIALGLSASGGSVREMMAALDGNARVVVGEGRLPGKLADWSSSVIGQVVDVLNPYRVSEDGSPLKCAVVNVPIRRGVITIKDTIAGETDKMVGAVSGSVDLGEERLDVVLHSQTTGGLTPGLADFASAGKLTGTLSNPKLAVNVQGTAVAGLRIGAAIATAGVSLIAESAARKAMPAHPCQVALAAQAPTAPDAAQPEPAESDAAEKKPGFFGRMLGRKPAAAP